jgi:thiosulfate/3-mercaptopyruvate sulfurtransferase
MESLVTTGALAAELSNPELVVLDATWYMPGDARNARELHAAARIPGARYFDIDLIADQQTRLPHMVPSPEFFAQQVGALGVSNASRVVCYDQHGIMSAPRARWMFRLYGHDQVAVLDGGLPKWRAEGRELQSGPPAPAAPAAPARFQSALRVGLLRGLGDLRDNLRTRREQMLDARSADRFHARVPEPRPGLRGGHVPGARSLPFGELLTPQQTLLPPAALRARFAAAGVDERSAVITSCGSGLTAAVLNLALAVAGLPEGALYDGSWAEWGGRDDTPVEA